MQHSQSRRREADAGRGRRGSRGLLAFLLAASLAPAVGATRDGPADPVIAVAASATERVPDPAIVIPGPPAGEELAGDSVSQFVVHHATVHYRNLGTRGGLARWQGGARSICALTVGLSPGLNAFVTTRLRALATLVGAPVASGTTCKENVRIVFTAEPRAVLDKYYETSLLRRPGLRFHYSGGGSALTDYEPDRAVEGWYATTTGAAGDLNSSLELVALHLLPLWPRVAPLTDARDTGGMGAVLLAVDTTRIGGYPIGALADYLATLALSVAQSPKHCDALPSILDLLSETCDSRARPTGVTAGDIAFLKALYARKGPSRSLTRDEIEDHMLRQFGRR